MQISQTSVAPACLPRGRPVRSSAAAVAALLHAAGLALLPAAGLADKHSLSPEGGRDGETPLYAL